ncbi:acetolactate decarboxylase [Aestuariivirga sp.]|uniref:acetolactate decarboxylase n=1 Tax=Aestuariivirga sp. TaxID=2650926 RepID=UPI003BAA84B3
MSQTTTSRKARAPVFISAPLAALVEGIYRADTTIGEIRKKGNLGIGTFNDLDGEMVLLDGLVYCLRPQGDAELIGDDVRTPFALATQFEGDTEDRFDVPVAESDFEHAMLDLVPSPNLMYAFRIDGHFNYVRARSVPKQSNYLPLAEIAKLQTVFEYHDIEGTIVGFYTPTFLAGVHLAGLHLHFITADRLKGGHLLAAAPKDITVKLQHAPAIELGLPMTFDFLAMDRTRDMEADLNKVER